MEGRECNSRSHACREMEKRRLEPCPAALESMVELRGIEPRSKHVNEKSLAHSHSLHVFSICSPCRQKEHIAAWFRTSGGLFQATPADGRLFKVSPEASMYRCHHRLLGAAAKPPVQNRVRQLILKSWLHDFLSRPCRIQSAPYGYAPSIPVRLYLCNP